MRISLHGFANSGPTWRIKYHQVGWILFFPMNLSSMILDGSIPRIKIRFSYINLEESTGLQKYDIYKQAISVI